MLRRGFLKRLAAGAILSVACVVPSLRLRDDPWHTFIANPWQQILSPIKIIGMPDRTVEKWDPVRHGVHGLDQTVYYEFKVDGPDYVSADGEGAFITYSGRD